MGNHYIPQKYLLRFADGDGGLWVHDRQKDESYRTGPRAVANEVGMYSDEVEKELNDIVEIPTHHVFEKILRTAPLLADDRAALAKYITVMWKRVPAGRRRTFDILPKVTDEIQMELMGQIDSWVKDEPSLAAQAEAFREKANAAFVSHRESPSSKTWYESFRVNEVGEAELGLQSMNWVFLHSPNGQFLTSDNPVFFFAHEGIGSPQSELTFPISSTVALWATRRPYANGTHLAVSPMGLRQLNRRTAHNHDRFVFSRTNEGWIKPFTMKGVWELSRLQ